jgi:hypothetical protein
MLYIMIEWCLQSHLSTADMHKAARGLQRTRRFRWFTMPFRELVHLVIETAYSVRFLLLRTVRRIRAVNVGSDPRPGRRSVRWTREITCKEVEHDHTGVGRPMADLQPGRPRGGSDIPLINANNADGRPMSINMDIGRAHNPESGTISPRSSYDTLTTTASPRPSSVRASDRQPIYNHQTSNESGPDTRV